MSSVSSSTSSLAGSTTSYAGTIASIGSTTNSNTLQSSLAVSGIASGMNWQSTVAALANAERGPETQWENQQSTIAGQNAAYGTISSDLQALQTDAQNLMDPTFFQSVVANTSNNVASGSNSNATVATASAASGTPVGNYSFNITQLATQAQMVGASNVSQVLDPGGDPSTVTVGAAGFATPVTAGTFTIDGAQVTVATTDSLQTVFNNIASATNNKVTASYDATTDKITLASSDSSEIVLGSATDTSNFLQSAQLYNNGGSSLSSLSALGHVNTSATLADADLATTINDGGSGNGAFTINGVTINYNAGSDTIQDLLNNINESAAGVTAAYDSVNNRFTITNDSTGDVGISMKDVTGNFLTATGLAGGALSHGKNLLYNVNNGTQQLVSQSNTITGATSGITGLSLSAQNAGSISVAVSPDVTTMSNGIQQFVNDYNAVQKFVASQTAVSTSASGTVTPGTLTGDSNTNDIVSSLRSAMAQVLNTGSSSGNSINSLADLGFKSNGNDNTIALSSSSTLTAALTSNVNAVAALFSNTTTGLGQQLNTYINNTISTSGTLTTREADLKQESVNINTQISNLENKISADSANWTNEFQNMESATAQTNQELSYLSQSVSSGAI